jgi:UrcA family protein
MFRTMTIIAATTVLTALASAGGARGINGLPIVEGNADVAYGDLDLNRPQDAAIMLGRIEKAARRACGIMPERDRFYSSNPEFVDKQFRLCTRQAVRDAVTHLGAPHVSRAYAKKNGGPDTSVARH